MVQTEMNEQEVGTLVYWEISQAARSRPNARSVTVGDALKIIGDRLSTLNPERRVAARLRSLQHEIIQGNESDDARYNSDVV